jgi:hypothetical protein
MRVRVESAFSAKSLRDHFHNLGLISYVEKGGHSVQVLDLITPSERQARRQILEEIAKWQAAAPGRSAKPQGSQN